MIDGDNLLKLGAFRDIGLQNRNQVVGRLVAISRDRVWIATPSND